MKYLKINPIKGVKDLFTENYKTFLREYRRLKQLEQYILFRSQKTQYWNHFFFLLIIEALHLSFCWW